MKKDSKERFNPRGIPERTELEERLYGKLYHHDVWCNADRRKPMGCEMCSCKYRTRKNIARK